MKRADKIAITVPPRPILGGTKQGVRPQRYSYWRTGYGQQTSPQLDFWVAQAGEYHCLADFATGDFEHSERLQFYYQTRGEAYLTSQDKSLLVEPGYLLIIPQGQTFCYRSVAGIDLHWFGVEGNVPAICGYQSIVCLSLGMNKQLIDKFVTLRELLIMQKRGYALQAIAILYEVLALLESYQAEESAESQFPDVLRVALQYIEENYQAPFDMKLVATHAAVSSSYLRQLFRKWVGESPQKSHTRHRMAAAERILTTQDLSIKEVAHQVGYKDPSHFSRVFKKIVGVAPSALNKGSRTKAHEAFPPHLGAIPVNESENW